MYPAMRILKTMTKSQQQIMDIIKCTPPYWIHRVGVNSSAGMCESGAKLRYAYTLIQDYKNILKSYYSSCIKMEVLGTFNRESSIKGEDPRMTILYKESEYEELSNTKSFDFASFVSGVGGFIGIFLGYSILQIPGLLELVPSLLISLKRNIKEGELINIQILQGHINIEDTQTFVEKFEIDEAARPRKNNSILKYGVALRCVRPIIIVFVT